MSTNGATGTDTSHPLNPLSAEEISQTTTILRGSGRITPMMRIMAYSPHEPDKRTVLAWAPGQPVRRSVDVVIRDHERRLTIEALVSLPEGEVACKPP